MECSAFAAHRAWACLPIWSAAVIYDLHKLAHLTRLRRIASFAIEKHGTHIVLDVHSLPGDTTGLDISEASGHCKEDANLGFDLLHCYYQYSSSPPGESPDFYLCGCA